MRAVIQRVTQAKVTIDESIHGQIETGLLVLLGIEDADGLEDIDWLAAKIIQLRIFNDEEARMNRSLQEIGGDILLVSQFTLFATVKKGNRPGYSRASKGPVATPLYEKMIQVLETGLGKSIQTGVFGADMKVSLLNDGPVTIFLDSKNRE